MKCPKCGYHSFDHLDSCKKCGKGLAEHKEKFNLRGFFSPGQSTVAEVAAVDDESDAEEEPSADGSVDFGFDFLDEEKDPQEGEILNGEAADVISLGSDKQAVNIDQPFGADSETIPADAPATENENDAHDKPNKGPEFVF
jgi:hypothetical protein